MSTALNWPGHFQCNRLLLNSFPTTHKHIDVVWMDYEWPLPIAIESNFDNDVTTIFVNRHICAILLSLVYQRIYYFIHFGLWFSLTNLRSEWKRNGSMHWRLNFSFNCSKFETSVIVISMNILLDEMQFAICHLFYFALRIDLCLLFHLKRAFLSSCFLSESQNTILWKPNI